MVLILTERDLPAAIAGGDKSHIHWLYNALDCAVTREVRDEMPALTSEQQRIYRFEHACQAPALAMSLRGVLIDPKRRDKAIAFHEMEMENAERQIADLAAGLWDRSEPNIGRCGKHRNHLWPRALERAISQCRRCGVDRLRRAPFKCSSHQQVATLLYDKLGVRPRKNRDGGVTTDDDALGSIKAEHQKRAAELKRPAGIAAAELIVAIVSRVQSFREHQKQVGYARSRLSSDGRMRSSFNVGATETGRWSASQAADRTGWNCVTGDHEVLTRRGWVAIVDWEATDEIVVGDGLNCWFGRARKFEKCGGDLVSLSTPWVSATMTPDHRIPYFTRDGAFKEARAADHRAMDGLPLGGLLVGEYLPENITRACVMMQADGHICKDTNRISLRFAKSRKIARCRELLLAAGLSFKEYKLGNGQVDFALGRPPQWLKDAKFFGPWLLSHDPRVVVDELPRWDGHKQGNKSPVYYSTILANVEWIKTMVHLAGGKGQIKRQCEGSVRRNTCYRISLQLRGRVSVKKLDYSETILSPARVYCAITEPGFFLIRHRGCISLTGNCQQISERLRGIVVADPGLEFFYADLKSAESQVVAFCAEDEAYIAAHATGDTHTAGCRLVWPELPWTGDLKLDKELAEKPTSFDPHHDYRRYMKVITHGCNNGQTPHGISRNAHLTLENSERVFSLIYDKTFPGVIAWHRGVRATVQRDRKLTTPLGRERQFLGRTWDDSAQREALAYTQQGTVADVLNLALWRVWSELDTRANVQDAPHPSQPNLVWLCAQVHDALLGLYRPGDTATLRRLSELMTIPILIRGRLCVIPVEILTGPSWSKKEMHVWSSP